MYAYENYRKVKALIEERRLNAIAESEARCAEVAMRSEDVRIIDAELRGVGLRLFKAACAGEDITPIKERNQFLFAEKRRALKNMGLSEDYTEVHYTCPDCSDSGFVGTKMCRCFRELLITENIKSSGIGRLIEKQSFDNFELSRYAADKKSYELMKENLEIAKEFAKNPGSPYSTLLFIGDTGTGKTHLSTAIAKAVIERGLEVVYDSVQNIISDFEADRFKSGYGPYEPRADKYLECDLLIVDDLGTEFVNQFTVSCIYNLINTRQNKGLATLISTNLKPRELVSKYEDRIYSRLVGCDSKILVFSGADARIES
ncbi:MAG: ATP-binding protein [Clostridia bacterium]|nr:ATP-binding protein [Clostridia bacterium]